MSNNNFNDILQEINNSKVTFDAFSPSTNTTVQFLPLTLAQQKSIIETSVDSSLGALFFNNTFYKILKQNIKGDISKYNTVDRVNFAIQLRAQLFDTYVTKNDSKFSLKALLEKNKTLQSAFTSKEITSDNFTFCVEVPNLTLDDKVNTILLNKYRNENINGTKLKTLISDLYVFEILKFVTKLKVNSKEVDLHQDLNAGANLLEKIDSVHFTNVTSFINEVRDVEKNLATLPGTTGSVDIVPDFFIV
jgi:hypothetical protein